MGRVTRNTAISSVIAHSLCHVEAWIHSCVVWTSLKVESYLAWMLGCWGSRPMLWLVPRHPLMAVDAVSAVCAFSTGPTVSCSCLADCMRTRGRPTSWSPCCSSSAPSTAWWAACLTRRSAWRWVSPAVSRLLEEGLPVWVGRGSSTPCWTRVEAEESLW
jgi:hypothetical protein